MRSGDSECGWDKEGGWEKTAAYVEATRDSLTGQAGGAGARARLPRVDNRTPAQRFEAEVNDLHMELLKQRTDIYELERRLAEAKRQYRYAEEALAKLKEKGPEAGNE